MRKLILVTAAALCCHAHAESNGLTGSISPYFNILSETDLNVSGLPDISADGTAIGLRATVGSPNVYGYFDYQDASQEFDSSSVDLDNTEKRIGIGVKSDDPTLNFTGQLERYDVDFDVTGTTISDDGAGVHIGFESKTSDTAAFYASAGYLNLGETDGPEFKFGIKGTVADNVQLFGEYRTLTLEDDVDDDFKLTDVRLGASFMF